MSPFSTTRYVSPSRAAASAAERPAGPAPMIRRSSLSCVVAMILGDNIVARRAAEYQTPAAGPPSLVLANDLGHALAHLIAEFGRGVPPDVCLGVSPEVVEALGVARVAAREVVDGEGAERAVALELR